MGAALRSATVLAATAPVFLLLIIQPRLGDCDEQVHFFVPLLVSDISFGKVLQEVRNQRFAFGILEPIKLSARLRSCFRDDPQKQPLAFLDRVGWVGGVRVGPSIQHRGAQRTFLDLWRWFCSLPATPVVFPGFHLDRFRGREAEFSSYIPDAGIRIRDEILIQA
jgi:hypothetical protein